MSKDNNDEHQQDYKNAAEALFYTNRMGVGLPSIPDRKTGDTLPFLRLAELAIKIWDDLRRLKLVVPEDYCKVLQMTGQERTDAMVLATRRTTIHEFLSRFGVEPSPSSKQRPSKRQRNIQSGRLVEYTDDKGRKSTHVALHSPRKLCDGTWVLDISNHSGCVALYRIKPLDPNPANELGDDKHGFYADV